MSYGNLGREADLLLRNWLKNNPPSTDSRLPSERDFVKLLGVGHYAINRAMATLVAEGRVRREGYKLFYAGKPDKVVREPFSCNLVVAHGSLHRANYVKVAKELDVQLTVHSWSSLDEAVAILKKLDAPETSCVLFDPPHGQDSLAWEHSVNRLVRHNVPVVCLGQPLAEALSVLADYPRGLGLLISHLLELGHRELALATLSPRSPMSIEVMAEWRFLCQRHNLSSSAERIFLQPGTRIMPEDSLILARKMAREWSKASALILFTDHEHSVQHLIDELAQQGREVPGKLSLVSLDDAKTLHTSNPPVTAATFDITLMQEAAFTLGQRLVRKKEQRGLLPPAYNLRIQPKLAMRSSVRNLIAGKTKSSDARNTPQKQLSAGVSTTLPAKDQDWDACLRRPYPVASKSREDRFVALDLGAYVNRPLNFRRGWLGDYPLKYFGSGRQMIHGVPFQIRGGTTRSECGAVVFHSSINTIGNAQKLPDTLTLPIHLKAVAIYILHGCGYAKFLETFGHYEFFHKRKSLGSVPLIPLGWPPTDLTPAQMARAYKKANIQDWWPDYPHQDFPGGRMAPLFEGEAPGSSHRPVFLYTLEWINPSPDKEVTHMEIRVDSKLSSTLGLLSVCVLQPKEH